MALMDEFRQRFGAVGRTSGKVPVVPDIPLPTVVSDFQRNIVGLTSGTTAHRVRPYLSDMGPRPFPRPVLNGLLIPPKLRGGLQIGVQASHLNRANVTKKVSIR